MSFSRKSFWSGLQITKSGCWLWQGAKTKGGYGQLSVNGKHYEAHRLAYELVKGPIPKGKQVRHSCDVSACCNPKHLLLGSHLDNMRDRSSRGRTATGKRTGVYTTPEKKREGESHGMAKLVAQDIGAIRKSSKTQSVLAQRYGVTQAAISDIRRRRTWKHL